MQEHVHQHTTDTVNTNVTLDPCPVLLPLNYTFLFHIHTDDTPHVLDIFKL